jgi:hypothetical protein
MLIVFQIIPRPRRGVALLGQAKDEKRKKSKTPMKDWKWPLTKRGPSLLGKKHNRQRRPRGMGGEILGGQFQGSIGNFAQFFAGIGRAALF